MAEAAHGTAPSLEGKNVANPMAMILAAAALLAQTEAGASAGRAIRESALEAVANGVRTADLGGRRLDQRVHRRGDRPRPLEAGGVEHLGGALVSLGGSAPPPAVRRERDGAEDGEHDAPR